MDKPTYSVDTVEPPRRNKKYEERKEYTDEMIKKFTDISQKQDRKSHPFRKQWGKRSKNAVPYDEWVAKQGDKI